MTSELKQYDVYDAIESLKKGSTDTYCFAMDSDPIFQEWDTGKFGTPPTLDEINTEKTRLNNEAYPMANLRYKRNQLLRETDWMAGSDLTISDEWKTYRQQLRDLPANTSDATNPTWPTKP